MFTSIKELDKWCVLHNKIIVVRRGKLAGFICDFDR